MPDPMTPSSPQSTPPLTQPPEEPHRSLGWLMWGGVIVIIVLVGGAIGWFILGRGEADQPRSSDDQTTSTTSQKQPEVIYGSLYENDKDLDGLDDAKEQELGTSDLEIDSDGDGLRDVEEIEIWKTDPTKADTDGDGFADGFEIIKGYNPNGSGTL